MNQDQILSVNKDNLKITEDWHNINYTAEGFAAQRLYPNEELLRFFGRNFFHMDRERRQSISVLEVGCGTCSNLWMMAREGFDTYGIDLSAEAIKLGEEMLAHWGTSANLSVASMTQLPYENANFDVVCDVLSSTCLDYLNFKIFLAEVSRVLKVGGKFFTYTPSIHSDAFINFAPAEKIDEFTLNGIYREDSPFYGNFSPFRFTDTSLFIRELRDYSLRVERLELVTKTYNNMKENFQFISLETVKER